MKKKYIITGANSDIGFFLIKELLKDDNEVIGSCRTPTEKLQGFKHKNFHLIPNIDLTNKNCLSIFGKEIRKFGIVEFHLIHSVGDFWHHKSIVNTSQKEATNLISSHYISLYSLLKMIIPVFIENKGGKILVFSCNSVLYNYPDMAAFTSAKAAIETLVRCTANENSKYGIVANAIALSTINTEKVKESKDPKYHNDYMTLDELKEVIVSILDLPKYINGNIIKTLKYSKYFYNEGYYKRNIIVKKETVANNG